MQIGDLIKKIRTIRGLTQTQLTEKLGISQNYLSLIETNKKKPSSNIINAFATQLKISEDAILFLATDPPIELNVEDKNKYIRLQDHILSLIVFEINGRI